MPTNPLEKDIITSYEEQRQTALRRLRRDARDRNGDLVSYLATSGEALALTGDEEAPYVKVINSATDPVQVTGSVTIAANTTVLVQGNVANDAADTGAPVKVGARADGLGGASPVGEGDRVNLIANTRGSLHVQLAGGRTWGVQSGGDIGAFVTDLVAVVGNAMIGRVEIGNGDTAAGIWALFYDGVDSTGTLRGVFYVPAGGAAVVDYTTLGAIFVTAGFFVQLTDDLTAISAPATGGIITVFYQLP